MALDFSALKKPPNPQVVDPDTGRMREEWQLYFDQLTTRLNGTVGVDTPAIDAEYLVGATNGTLTAERVVTNTTTIGWDLATAGQAKANVLDNSIGNAKLVDGAVTVAKVDASASGNRWGVVASVGQSDGGMEVGQYIDFHNTDGDTSDYSVRLNSIGLTSNFQVQASSPNTTRNLLGAATDAEIRASSLTYAGVSAAALASAAALVTLTDAATIAVDWSTFINSLLTITANRVLGNPTNPQPGTWRTILVQGNNATLRTLTFGTNYAGSLPTLIDITSSKGYLLSIYCVHSTLFILKSTQAFP